MPEEPDWRLLFPEHRSADYQPSVDADGRKYSQRELYERLKAGGKMPNSHQDHLDRVKREQEEDSEE